MTILSTSSSSQALSSERAANPVDSHDLRPGDRRFEWLVGLALLVAVFFILFDFPRGPGLAEPDEGRYADIPAEMARSGDFVTPRLDGVRYFEKPPLLYWAGTAAVRALGPTVAATRLPTHLAAILSTLFVGLAAGRLAKSRRAALLAAVVYLSSMMVGVLARIISIDTILSLGTTATTVLLLFAIERVDRGEKADLASSLVAGLSLGIGILAKGPVAVVLAAGSVGLWWILSGKSWRNLFLFRPFLTGGVAFVLAAPWFFLVSAANPRFLQFFFVREHLQRFATNIHDRGAPPGTLLLVFLAGTFPWTLFAVRSTVSAISLPVRHLPGRLRLRRSGVDLGGILNEQSSADLFLVSASLFPVLFFSISRSQLPTYVLPAMAPAAILAASWVVREERAGRSPWQSAASVPIFLGLALAVVSRLPLAFGHGSFENARRALLFPALAWIGCGLAFFLFSRTRLGFPLFAVFALAGVPALIPATVLGLGQRDSLEWSRSVKTRLGPGDTPVFYSGYVWSLPFVLERPVAVCNYKNELEHGMSYPDASEIAWDSARLRREWKAGRRIVVIVEAKHLQQLLQEGLEPFYVDPSAQDGARIRILASNEPWPDPAHPGGPGPPKEPK